MTANLRHSVRLIDLVMLGAGTAIGAAIFTVLGPAAKVGGYGVLIATILAALPMGLFAVVYAYLASTAPRTAASFEWQRQFTSPALAFAIVWMRVLSNAVVMIVLARVLISYLSMVLPLPATPTILGFFALIFALNYIGVAVAARAQTILMILLLGALSIFVFAAAPKFDPQLFVKATEGGILPILAALPLMIQLFLGIETATEVGEEVADAERKIPLGMAGALTLTVVVYLAVTFAAMSAVGPEVLAVSKAPLLDAAKAVLGPVATPLIVTAAVFALAKSMNAVFLVYARFLFAMGRAGVLPAALGRVHPKFGTPHVASIVALCGCVTAVFLPSSLLFLLLAVNVPTMMKYFGTCLAAFNVAKSHPEVHAAARLKFSQGTVKVLAALGCVAAVVIAALGFGTDWRPYGMLLIWLALGMAWYAWGAGRRAAA
ncbi:amino acid permease [Caulobacter segnis]|uniref:APC family permease n=1 Tax=Caulobacter segnis TaxID=88688 RepID=UPI00240F88B8|nr:amino acid permease [Caulobacter segnis]MDG2523026.1 amino acid permease [Caulobacter segnis]